MSGTPTGSSSTFTVRVASGDGQTATREFTITVNAILSVTTTSLPDGVENVDRGDYSFEGAAAGKL